MIIQIIISFGCILMRIILKTCILSTVRKAAKLAVNVANIKTTNNQ